MKTKTTILLLFLFSTLFAQERIPNELIIQLKAGVSSDAFFQAINHQRNVDESLLKQETISALWRIYKVPVSGKQENVSLLLENLQSHSDVAIAGYNFKLEQRTKTPNDVLFDEQWGMDAINVADVWECTTGGLTALGDTIVVANLEGSDIFHDDLSENIWRNNAEIPNNGIDDDENGYVDDYFGVNISNDGDNHLLPDHHGTQVAGIIGARGNNDIGVSGINWSIKVMIVSTDSLVFSDIIKGYEYIYESRRLYNDTNGAEGAFVVSTNASFGARGFMDSNPWFPLWCAMYDDLGEVGVLNAGATSNSNVDIDEIGDMPTSCPSEYLVAVTDVNRFNELRGGYSAVNVDLGAPGGGVKATGLSNVYTEIGGTSSATPHVSGGIALLHSLPCKKWAQFAIDEPAQAAKLMKEFLLDGARPMAVLKEKTVSGGFLDLRGSMELIQEYCGSKVGPLDFVSMSPNPTDVNLHVEFRTSEVTPYKVRVYNAIGQLLFDEEFTPEKFGLKEFDIDVSGYAAGVYFISIENNNDIVGDSFVVYRR